jgi:enterochelin esterase-like enzyme
MEKRMKYIGMLLVQFVIFIGYPASLKAQENQVGKKYYDLYLKTGDSWKMINKEITVTRDFQPDDPKLLPGKFFHGALLKKEIEGREPGPVLLHLDYPSDGDFIFYLQTVSDTGIFKITLDNKELKTFTFLTGPEGKGPWTDSRFVGNGIYQCDYNKEYSVRIPAGKHDLILQNMGTDWMNIGYFVFTGYAEKILNPEYEEWKKYESSLDKINERLENYKRETAKTALIKPGEINYDLIPTLKLQIENFEGLAKNHTSVDLNLIRTEKELKEVLGYLESGKDYFKTKRGRIKTGYLSTIDSTFQPYDVVIPQNYDPAKKYALVLLLHGSQNEIRKYSELVPDDKKFVTDSLGIIKVAVYGRRNHFYLGAAEEDLLTVLNKVESDYSIDPEKVYLTGSSMGGFGTWFIGLNYPHLFAAVSPVCGPSIFTGTKFLNSINPIEYISNASHLPARIYHGAADSTVKVNNSRSMVARLKELNYDYVYTEYPGVGHDSWNNADADNERLPWLLKNTLNSYPSSVKHKAFYLRYGKAYWLQITGKKDWNKFSEIEGSITEKNSISIKTENITSFYIDLRHPDLNRKKAMNIIIDGKSVKIRKCPEGIDFHISPSSQWVRGKLKETILTKKSGLEGPATALETGKFLIVYGTGKAEKVNILKKIGTLVQNEFSNSAMEIKLVPDTAVIKDKLAETNNLYLIGSPNENRYLQTIVSRLPVSFDSDSLKLNGSYSRLETGLKMIYPNPEVPDKYIYIDKYPEFLPDVDQIINYPVADYFIYSLKGGKFQVLKDEYFGSDWKIIK